MKVRAYSVNCPLDFANLPVYWLEDVKPEQSMELLSGMVFAETPEGVVPEERSGASGGDGHRACTILLRLTRPWKR